MGSPVARHLCLTDLQLSPWQCKRRISISSASARTCDRNGHICMQSPRVRPRSEIGSCFLNSRLKTPKMFLDYACFFFPPFDFSGARWNNRPWLAYSRKYSLYASRKLEAFNLLRVRIRDWAHHLESSIDSLPSGLLRHTLSPPLPLVSCRH